MSISEFFHMGGYGFYVWGAYGTVALLMLLNTVIPIARHRRLLQQARRQQGDSEQ